MSEVKYKIIDKNTLELTEDAKAGDQINLKSQFKVDTSIIERLIEESKDEVYQSKLSEEKVRLNEKFNLTLKVEKSNLRKPLDEEILSLKNKIKELENNKDKDIKLKEEEIKNNYQFKISSLESDLKTIESKNSLKLADEKGKLKEELEAKFKEEVEQVNKDRDEWKNKYEQLHLEKSSLNVKKLGEELEHYCNEEFLNAKVAGFEYASWEKDNDAIKYENENKGTKADYIFKVYSSLEFSDENLLSSVCLEMKNEALDSTHKKKNADHFKKLDEDRKKKQCEYALLVSELERDTHNDSPIKIAEGYEKMYVVRPQYMMSFLSLIYSLSMRYKEILNSVNKEKYEFKEKEKILEEFDKLKTTYLINPLESLEKDVRNLNKNNEDIISAGLKNRDLLSSIINNKFNNIEEKINRFDITKICRKLDKLENKD